MSPFSSRSFFFTSLLYFAYLSSGENFGGFGLTALPPQEQVSSNVYLLHLEHLSSAFISPLRSFLLHLLSQSHLIQAL